THQDTDYSSPRRRGSEVNPTDEERILADLFIDLKSRRKKRDNWIEIAQKCDLLAREYGSPKRVAEKVGVSYELMRSILSLLKLSKEAQQLDSRGEILYDAAQRLNRIKDPTRQAEVAKAIAGLPSHKAREIIQYAKRFPNTGLGAYKRRVTAPE